MLLALGDMTSDFSTKVTPGVHIALDPILKQPYEISDSELQIPDVPGVGLEWDEKAVSANLADSF